MKFRVTFKDPDGVADSIYEAAKNHAYNVTDSPGERDILTDLKEVELLEFTDPWIVYEEYITVEFDTEAKTATVVKVR